MFGIEGAIMNQQLVSYIQQQLKSGYDINAIMNFLLQQGYNANEVNGASEFVNRQRISSLIDYVKSSLSKGVDPDSIKSQLLASGYPMPDINDALTEAQKKHAPLPISAILMILVALVIFGLGLFFFWPSGKAGDATRPGIIENGGVETGEETETPGIAFETEKRATFEELPETGQKTEEFVKEEEVFGGEEETEQAAEETEEKEFSAETSDFDNLIDKASSETNMENALNICQKEESVMYRDACYDQLSKTFESSAICERIEDASLKDSCYLRIVLKSKDYSLCSSIADQSLRNSCASMQTTAPAGNITTDTFADWTV